MSWMLPFKLKSRRPTDGLSLAFEVNQGQADKEVKFLSRGSGYSFFLTPTEAVLQFSFADSGLPIEKDKSSHRQTKLKNQQSSVLRVKLAGASPVPQIEGLDQLPGKSHYFTGNDPSQWRTAVADAREDPLRSGLSRASTWSTTAISAKIEYDFIVAPGCRSQGHHT